MASRRLGCAAVTTVTTTRTPSSCGPSRSTRRRSSSASRGCVRRSPSGWRRRRPRQIEPPMAKVSDSASAAKRGTLRVLAIESSCDETGVALIEDGRVIRANVVASQASVHAQYGGVVPEVASRRQLEALIPVLETAFAEAGAGWEAVDAIAATYGPGLTGSLLVGLTAGKTLALARGLPFIGVNHLEAHIYANWLWTSARAQADPTFPLLALVVSGAHSELVSIAEHGAYELLGQTRDDAAGEAFDKVARLLGLSYPG